MILPPSQSARGFAPAISPCNPTRPELAQIHLYQTPGQNNLKTAGRLFAHWTSWGQNLCRQATRAVLFAVPILGLHQQIALAAVKASSAAPAQRQSSANQAAITQVRKIINETRSLIADGKPGASESEMNAQLASHEPQLTAIIKENFDVGKFAQFVYPFPGGWAQLTPAQKSEYNQLCTRNMVKTYYKILYKHFMGGGNVVATSAKAFGSSNGLSVEGSAQAPNQKPLPVRWILRSVGPKFLVVELIVGATRLGEAKRKDFQHVAQGLRGNPKAHQLFIEKLRRTVP
jgi:ABC-type transporter MlaC component